jgi:endonuclease/exonuclease/phosphatase family metal-dependent hydrolase
MVLSLLVGCTTGRSPVPSTSNIIKTTPTFSYDGRQSLTVLTFNIRIGYGTQNRHANLYNLKDHKNSLSPIVEAIRSIDADIIGLQEVLANGQALELAKQLDMNVAVVNHAASTSSYPWWSVAILSKFPIVETEEFSVRSESGAPKSAIVCSIDVGGRVHHFLNFQRDKDSQNDSINRKIMQKIESVNEPMVLMGSFDASIRNKRLMVFRSRLTDSAYGVDTATARDARGIGTVRAAGRNDFILVEKAFYKVVDAGLAEQQHRWASDHIAYWTRIVPKYFAAWQAAR